MIHTPLMILQCFWCLFPGVMYADQGKGSRLLVSL